MGQFKLSEIDPVISILLATYVLLGCGISYVTSVEVTSDGVLLLVSVVAVMVAFVCVLHQLGWLRLSGQSQNPSDMSSCERNMLSTAVWVRSQLKSMTGRGAVTGDAIKVASEYVGKHVEGAAEVNEYVGMDAGIVFLVFAQVMFATLIAYATLVHVAIID